MQNKEIVSLTWLKRKLQLDVIRVTMVRQAFEFVYDSTKGKHI